MIAVGTAIWERLTADRRSPLPAQVGLSPDGYRQRRGMGPAELLRWRDSVEVRWDRGRHGWRLTVLRYWRGGALASRDVDAIVPMDGALAARVRDLVAAWQAEARKASP